jgi:hypothetical protein
VPQQQQEKLQQESINNDLIDLKEYSNKHQQNVNDLWKREEKNLLS